MVAGFRTPNELTEASRAIVMSEAPSMEKALPNAFAELLTTGDKLEAHFADVQEIEFTVESDRLWLLQTRGAKRTPAASLKIAVEMAEEGILTKQAAAARIDDDMLAPMLVSKVSPGPDDKVVTKGLPASPGAVSGIAVFTSEDAVAAREEEIDVILVRTETDPKDVHGMHASVGILTSRGGMTSHAAVVARGMNKPCITAAMTLKIDTEKRVCSSMGIEIYQGDEITIDGGSGEVFLGRVETSTPEPDGDLAKLLSWKETG